MKIFKALIISCFAIFAASCSQLPKYKLSPDARLADALWVTTLFEENYAPLNYKEGLYGIIYQDAKAQFLASAVADQPNAQYYTLINQFVAKFKDAHTKATFPWASARGSSELAFLGFFTQRAGEKLRVSSVFPSLQYQRAFPIRQGDIIEKIDGLFPRDYCLTRLTSNRNLGSEEANFTHTASLVPLRIDSEDPMPESADISLMVLRDGKSVNIILPWVRMDLIDFMDIQAQAMSGTTKTNSGYEELRTLLGAFKDWNSGNHADILHYAAKFIPGSPGYRFSNTFELLNFRNPTAVSSLLKKIKMGRPTKADGEYIREVREIPQDVFWAPSGFFYPTYLSLEPKSFSPPGEFSQEWVATMYLDSFSVFGSDDEVVKEVKDTLAFLKRMGVHKLIIDTINNGGGSLSLGTRLAQALTSKKIDLPKIQLRVSETWIQQFEMASEYASTLTDRELAKRVYVDLKDAREKGERLSQVYSIDSLMPYEVVPNEGADESLKIALLVNEMCASMCDIFAGIMQDNGLATLVGQRTMGAGGNVVMHIAAANTGLMLNQTESLILRSNGEYIENKGVAPDVATVVSDDASIKYKNVRALAIKALQ